ncbi:GNAT family N-acetyltransferase [Prevotella intermedia]|uniref:GNAT family N-acetyltransferase n=1 Tax=Prevotella intermedia TaxID=28131 RepID=A0A2M8TSM5_PREIN|nr:GNAT family N-acetyltransferase [Prevotella intermedia]PJI26929.1 GNAT family N-acetyltransferase [Prevotella intermedia]
MIEIKQYNFDDAAKWNEFVTISKQGTFLFNRNYMDYHADRFADCSFVVTEKGRIAATLPANRKGDTLYSHQGLTYGGLLTTERMTAEKVCNIFSELNILLKEMGIKQVVYKAIPWIYHCIPAEEDLYALTNICHAQLVSRDISSSFSLHDVRKFTESRRSGIRKAARNGILVSESQDLAAFWNILNNNLTAKYDASPVHSLAELQLLMGRFAKEIKLYMATTTNGEPLGGTLIYETPNVVHTQYISASPDGKAMGALDLLFDYIINKVYKGRNGYFDFGKSTEASGTVLNQQLIHQKEGFGGRGVCYDTYEWKI